MSACSDFKPAYRCTTTNKEYRQTFCGRSSKHIKCPYETCTKSFNRQARLTEHLRSHTNERPFSCSEDGCDKAFFRDTHLKHHIRSAHINERTYHCLKPGCGKSFATGTRLRRHQAGHEDREKYTCRGYDGCNETFRKHATLSRHIRAVHEKLKPFPCPEVDCQSQDGCEMSFNTAEKLRSHRRAVHDQSRFVCSDCSAQPRERAGAETVSFSTHTALKRHIAETHPPICPQCSLRCTSDKDLRRHLELMHDTISTNAPHNKETYICTHANCGRSFSRKGNLNVHIRTVHEGRKDFVCGLTAVRLTTEEVRRTGQPLPAEPPKMQQEKIDYLVGCGRIFTSKASLREHVRTIHLGLDSRRQQRHTRKQAEKAAINLKIGGQTPGVEPMPPSKRRKLQCTATKAIEQKSAIAKLTGSSDQMNGSEFRPIPTIGENPFDHLLLTHTQQQVMQFSPDLRDISPRSSVDHQQNSSYQRSSSFQFDAIPASSHFNKDTILSGPDLITDHQQQLSPTAPQEESTPLLSEADLQALVAATDAKSMHGAPNPVLVDPVLMAA